MSRLTRIARLFTRGTRPKRRAAADPPANRVRLSVDHLGGRESPAALAFASGAGIFGGAALDGAAATAIRLPSGNSGNIAAKVSTFGYPQSQSYATLTNYSGASPYKTVDLTTSAYTTNLNTSSEAVARTTSTASSGGYSYVGVQVLPQSGELYGQRVQVTLTMRFTSTVGTNNRGLAANTYSFYVNGQQYLGGTDAVKGTKAFARTVTVATTIGSTVNVAFHAGSYAGPAGGVMYSNVATLYAGLQMSVQRV